MVPPEENRRLVFAAPPIRAREQLSREFEPTLGYIGRKANAALSFHISDDYQALVTDMQKGIIDLGFFTPVAYVQASKSGEAELLLQVKVNGSYWYSSTLIVRKDSGIDSIDGLRGKTFAFGDKLSTSGYYYPTALLLDKGVNPFTFFGAVRFANSHDRVLQGVLNGDFAGGAVADNVLPELLRVRGVPVEELKVIAQSEAIPQSVIAVRPTLDGRLKERLRFAFAEMGYSIEGRAILAASSLGLQGFAPVTDSEFDAVRRTISSVDNLPAAVPN